MTIDGYVPLDIKILDQKKLPPLYWRVGDGKKSLLELAVLPENGCLSAITLVMIESSSIHKADSLSVHLSDNVDGLPVVNTALWEYSGEGDFSQRFVDSFNLKVQVITSEDSIFLVIGENEKVSKWIRCGGGFYLGIDDERNIVNLFLDNLTKSEMERFLEAVS